MIDKQTILDSMLKEIACIKHLAAKVRPGTENWRPTPGQRSVIELLRYISYTGYGSIQSAVTGDWEGGKARAEAASKLSLADIPGALDAQARELKRLFAEIPSGDFLGKQVARPGTEPTSLGRFILDSSFKYLPAYKMQLFQYLKLQGVPNLGTPNLWRGQDAPAKP